MQAAVWKTVLSAPQSFSLLHLPESVFGAKPLKQCLPATQTGAVVSSSKAEHRQTLTVAADPSVTWHRVFFTHLAACVLSRYMQKKDFVKVQSAAAHLPLFCVGAYLNAQFLVVESSGWFVAQLSV
jgi:hypothetical protein